MGAAGLPGPEERRSLRPDRRLTLPLSCAEEKEFFMETIACKIPDQAGHGPTVRDVFPLSTNPCRPAGRNILSPALTRVGKQSAAGGEAEG